MNQELLARTFRTKLNEVFVDSIRFTVDDARKIATALSEIFAEDLVNEGETRIPGIGLFKVKMVKGRAGRNPKTGEAIVWGDSHKAKFTPCKELRDSISEKYDA